jgi:hypothetical protein
MHTLRMLLKMFFPFQLQSPLPGEMDDEDRAQDGTEQSG